MALKGSRVKQIQQALLSAYNEAGLRRMLRIGMDVNLDEIVPKGDLETVVFELITWAERKEQIGALIHAACESNTTNRELIVLAADARKWGLSTSLSAGAADTLPISQEFDVVLLHGGERSKSIGKLEDDLTSAGLKCWKTRTPASDGIWWPETATAIRTARTVLVVLDSDQADWRLIKHAIAYARSQSVPVYPVLLSDNPGLLDESSLSGVRPVNLHTDREEEMAWLVTSLKLEFGVTASALDKYSQAQGGSRPLNEAKLILVGFGAVGKTSLVNRLVNDTFNENEPETPGIRRIRWPVTIVPEGTIQVNVWDFGGQVILHAAHQIFLTKDTLYLLVIAGRQGHEEEDTEYWLSIIRSFGGNSPIIIVLNKIEEHRFAVDRRGLMEKYPQIVGFAETDCEARVGIEDLKSRIQQVLGRLEHVHMPIPTRWFDIKNTLSSMPNDFLSIESYREICGSCGEEDEQAQNTLLQHLHRLGIMLTFENDPTRVLNPEWVTDGFYAVIRAAQDAKQNGELWLSQLGWALDLKKYPVERHRFLLELMNKFDLIVDFSDQTGRYLIPSLLEKEQPPEASEFSLEKCLCIRYVYDVLPESIMPRFIAKTHRRSRNQPRWRNGVILEFEGNRALIKADRRERRIDVMLSGLPASHLKSWAVIQDYFESVHEPFAQKPTQFVLHPRYPGCIFNYDELMVFAGNGHEWIEIPCGRTLVKVFVTEILGQVPPPDRQASGR